MIIWYSSLCALYIQLTYFIANLQIEIEEKKDLLTDTIDLNEIYSWRSCYSEDFVGRVFKHIGFHRSLCLILEIEEEFFRANIYDDSVFEAYLERIEEKGFITHELLCQFLQNEKSREHSSVISSCKAHKLLLAQCASDNSPMGEAEGHHGSIQKSLLSRAAFNGFSLHNTLKMDGLRDMSHPLGSVVHSQLQTIDQQSTYKTPTRLVEPDYDFKDMNATSIQSSDMAVSSYSLKSAAMMDSFSEEYMLSVDDEPQQQQPKLRKNSSNSVYRGSTATNKLEIPSKKDRVSII